MRRRFRLSISTTLQVLHPTNATEFCRTGKAISGSEPVWGWTDFSGQPSPRLQMFPCDRFRLYPPDQTELFGWEAGAIRCFGSRTARRRHLGRSEDGDPPTAIATRWFGD